MVKRNALGGDELVLIKRTKPGREPYWVTVGGGVEADDATIEAALRREVFEELGGKLERAELIDLITDELEDGVGVQRIFATRPESTDLAARAGTGFANPERGGYVPLIVEVVRELTLMPPQLAAFIAASTDAIVSVLDTPIREA
ncbi:NUDIX domain-containing protein [Streptomyces zhihengii]|uniref:NUDIX domain-containing protein n=1 Tax=Streptomyces zhihengii TaxID=1818004 RepID=UPI001FD4F488|nr:NUDIX domain-containing protein [Streptomyces zhihengii]